MRYCRQCIIPDSRPGICIGEDGTCSACIAHAEKKSEIDWDARKREFEALVETVRSKRRTYDCVIPVSGGKDSTWQAVTCLGYGLHALAVTWKTPVRNEIGARNLANLIRLGLDHMDFQVNPKVEKKFLYRALEHCGSTAIPMHMALFSVPLTMAVRFDIPLVIWGENSADEYAGAGAESRGHRLDGKWLRKYGVTQGTAVRDWISEELTETDLTPYFGPTEEELGCKQVEGVFLGYYFPWDPIRSLEVARAHGFQSRAEGPKTGYYDYADIDDDFISIHHYLKWHKFGFTRLFDNLSIEIRNGRMTREEAVRIVRERGDQTPHEDIDKFCDFVGISRQRFFEIVEKFRNLEIWTNTNGKWVIRDFLIPDWNWQ